MEKLTEGHKNSPAALLAAEADSGNQECHVSWIIVVIVIHTSRCGLIQLHGISFVVHN